MSTRSRTACRFGIAGAFLAGLAATPPVLAQSNVLFIVDSSGSMNRIAERNETRMHIAKGALTSTLAGMPDDVRVGMMVYGHRRAKDCRDIELTDPIGASNARSLAQRVASLQPRGETPIAAALELAARTFTVLKGQNNAIVLVTDGIEECGGDPCAAARAIKAAGVDLKVHVVGFTLDAKQRAAIECISKETGGRYFEARTPAGLRDALADVRQTLEQAQRPPRPPERFNLLERANGGELIVSPTADWQRVNDGKTDHPMWAPAGSRGVFGFKDGRHATFETFAVFVPDAGYNAREIELFAGDNPAGPFQSIAVVTLVDARVRDGWQEFTLPRTSARYVAIAIKSNNVGQNSRHIEWRLYGQLGDRIETTTPPVTPPQPARVNLLERDNGGELIQSPNADWQRVNDGKTNNAAWAPAGARGVFGFRNGRSATFDTFAVFIGDAGYNVKELELLVSDEGPAGQFRSIGVVTLVDARVRDGWQEFTLPRTTARYVAVVVKSNHAGGNARLTEFRLYGQVD